MPIQYRFIITAENDKALFADPARACADIAQILVDRGVNLLRPEALANHADMPAFELTDASDIDFPAMLEGRPDDAPTINGTRASLILVIQRGKVHKLRG